MNDIKRARLPFSIRSRVSLLRLLHFASGARGLPVDRLQIEGTPAGTLRCIWIYAATIGELNAVEPLLRVILLRLPGLQPVFITNHPQYIDNIKSRFPTSCVCLTKGHYDDARQLAQRLPPALLLIAEIPSRLSDAPCRFPPYFVVEAASVGAPSAVINGWLYGEHPASRVDHLERALLDRHYLNAFDAICVQTSRIRDTLIACGAAPERVHVAGNLKFDGMNRQDWKVEHARSPRLLANLLESDRPTVVAGCVTNLEEQDLVLDAFRLLLSTHPNAILVLAPRHPEVNARMEALTQKIVKRSVSFVLRTTLDAESVASNHGCLVLNSIGDLADFYAAAAAAHVGINHNVLEPLAFGKEVTVAPGWNSLYPSYPVYDLLRTAGVLNEEATPQGLARHWTQMIQRSRTASHTMPEARARALRNLQGAVQQHLHHLQPILNYVSDAWSN